MMNEITRKSDWGYWDQLDGVTLRDGELVIVQWPDGHLDQLRVTIKDHPVEIHDHGKASHVEGITAYAMISHRGVPALVSLLGLKAQRV